MWKKLTCMIILGSQIATPLAEAKGFKYRRYLNRDYSIRYYVKQEKGFPTRLLDRKWRTKYYLKDDRTYDQYWKYETRW